VGVAAPGGSAVGADGPASKFRRTCNLHACGLGVGCRELRAIGLTGDGLSKRDDGNCMAEVLLRPRGVAASVSCALSIFVLAALSHHAQHAH
jgi:hypothetical protein